MTPELYKRRSSYPSMYDPFRLFDDFFSPMMAWRDGRPDFRTDITDEGDHYLLEADLPGFKKEDISLEVLGNTLMLCAERHFRHEEEEKPSKYLRIERSYGSYKREFDLSGIDKDAIKAKYTDGVLTLTLPKKEQEAPKARQLTLE